MTRSKWFYIMTWMFILINLFDGREGEAEALGADAFEGGRDFVAVDGRDDAVAKFGMADAVAGG